MSRKNRKVDQKLMSRLDLYVEQCEAGKLQISPDRCFDDVPSIVDYLRKKYPDYNRKNLQAFRKYVEKALNIYLQVLEEAEKSSDSSVELNENVVLMEAKDTNQLNFSLRNAYSSRQPSAAAPTAAGGNSKSSNSSTSRKRLPEPTKTNSNSQQKKVKTRASDSVTGPQSSQDNNASSPAAVMSKKTFADLAGMEAILQDVRELVEYPLAHPEIYEHLGVDPPRGILLHGPAGCGKTLLANAIAGELQVPLLAVAAPEIVAGLSGESEAKIRALFDEAKLSAPCILFIDEIDAIAPKRETAQREMERRIVAQLLSCMDDLASDPAHSAVIVIGATNRPDALDSALRRAGRFDREIMVPIPDENGRCKILQFFCSKLKLSGDFNYKALARMTPGYVGADLAALAKEAAVIAINRIFKDVDILKDEDLQEVERQDAEQAPMAVEMTAAENGDIGDSGENVHKKEKEQSELHARIESGNRLRDARPLSATTLSKLFISMEDFVGAVGKVQPSARREGFAVAPDVTFNDIGALENAREELEMAIVQPIRNPERFEKLGLDSSSGVLLFGPPGCGKTLLAKAIANECAANFISIKGPELLNKFVGESEKAVRTLFERAKSASPCVIFFDELDALCPRRAGDSTNQVSERVVNQLLTEMDGLVQRRQLFVIGATNRPDIIDPAMLRPGRLDRLVYVPLPNADDREKILLAAARRTPLADDVSLRKIGSDERCEGFSGADLTALIREASVAALKESFRANSNETEEGLVVSQKHFEVAFGKVFPSVSKHDDRMYQKLRKNLRSSHVGEKKSGD